METLKDSKEPPEEYWNDCEDSNAFRNSTISCKKLISGINIKDLCDGKEVMFEISQDNCEDILESTDGLPEEIIHYDPKSLREKRGAPPLNRSFKEIASRMTNVTEDGLVKKQLISSGTGKTVSNYAYVTVHYNLYKESCELPFDSTYLRNRPEKFRLGQGEAILGLECAIRSMKKNENSMFFFNWKVAFGALGCPDRIGKKCDIVADIVLLNFVDVDPECDLSSLSEINKIDFTRCLNKAKQSMCNGRDEFTKGDTRAAVGSYRKALKILNSLNLADEIEESEMLRQKMKCLLNLAVCYNRLDKPEQACVFCQEALSIDQNSVKANFHYGRANIALSNFAAAKRYLFRAHRLKPNDKDINTEIKKLNDKRALYELKDRIFCANIFPFQNEKREEENAEEAVPAALQSFEKSLISSLEECLKEEKPYILPMPLLDNEMKICDRVATQMKMKFEKQPHFCIFKVPKNNSAIVTNTKLL